MGLLVPQPLALPLSGTTLGSGPSALEGDQEPASSVFSGSPAPPEQPQVSYTPGASPGPVPSGNQLPSPGSPRVPGLVCGPRQPAISPPLSNPIPLGVASLGLGHGPQCAGGLGHVLPQLILPHLAQSETRRTGTGSAATAAHAAGTASAGAGAETGATGTSGAPPGTGGDEANL